ncbi:response regulator [Fodinicola feengrottensis]|uniref:Transcriptional regulatory protein n=1 Tax=Fodinicola feengrottensis TaxID=435914 RepID=A0ABN2IT29_9ACTN
MIRVLVVDLDVLVASLHAGFVDAVPGFSVLGTAHSATEARGRIAELTPDLLLLDLHLPDDSALRLLAEIEIDTMVLTAAAESTTVRAALRAGALNYLLKPFTAAQLGTRLTAYARYQALLQGSQTLRQNDIDRAVRALHDNDRSSTAKGQSPVTARLVTDALRRAGRPRSAIEIATELGIARATAQRYLGALAESGEARIGLRYGATGRPEHEYSWLGEEIQLADPPADSTAVEDLAGRPEGSPGVS